MQVTQEYILLLVIDEPQKDGYLSNKHFITGGDLLFLDDLTTGYENPQDLGDTVIKTIHQTNNNNLVFSNAIIISQKEYERILKGEQEQPKNIINAMFSEHRDYYEYLCNNKDMIDKSLIRYVRIPGLAIDRYTTPNELKQVFHAYYGTSNDFESIPYKKIRDTYLEVNKHYNRSLKTKSWNI